MTSQVIEADPPTAFSWSVLTEAWDLDTSVWRYTIEEVDGGGVLLTHHYLMTRPPKGWQPILDRYPHDEQQKLVQKRKQRLNNGMRATLEALRAHVERATRH